MKLNYLFAFYFSLLVLIVGTMAIFSSTLVLFVFNEWRDKNRPRLMFTFWDFACRIYTGQPQVMNALYGRYFSFRLIFIGFGVGVDYLIEKLDPPPLPRPQPDPHDHSQKV